MEQLTGMDAMFLNLETPRAGGHVGSVAVFDTGDMTPAELVDELRDRLTSRLHLLAPYRRRLVEVPMGLDRPYWIEDPDFDLDFHLRRIAVPPPGSDRQLADLVGRLHSRSLDRDKALWEVYVIEGLESGHVAIYTKMHHCAIDGAGGVDLTSVVLDPTPEGVTVPPPATPWRGERRPGDAELLARTALSAARAPLHVARLLRSVGRSAATARSSRAIAPGRILHDAIDRVPLLHDTALASRIQERLPDGASDALPSRVAPRLSFNRSLSAHRAVAFGAVDFERIRALRRRHDVTVNDVVMAICAGALRAWLLAHEELPTEPLIAMVPVSLRTAADAAGGNRVGGIIAGLPTNLDDPTARLHAAHEAMTAAKRQLDLLDPHALASVADLTSPAVASALVRFAHRTRLADIAAPAVNLVISNVPGPPAPVYCGRARQLTMYPVSSLVDGLGLNITVVSYDGELQFGLLACAELVRDLDDLRDLLVAEVDALEALDAPTTDTAPPPTSPPDPIQEPE